MSLFKQAKEAYRREGLLTLVGKGIKTVKERILFILWDRIGIIEFDRLYGTDYYRRILDDDALADSRAFAQEVRDRVEVQSVIDFGCGPGRFLLPFYENGIEIHGVDASSIAQSESVVPTENIEQHDLRNPYNSNTDFDIALCIEVLEHLPQDASETVVNSIAQASDVAIVTAAPPGQGGTHHVNERPATYWINKFEEVDMIYDKSFTTELQNAIDPVELIWLESNLLVFRKK